MANIVANTVVEMIEYHFCCHSRRCIHSGERESVFIKIDAVVVSPKGENINFNKNRFSSPLSMRT